MTQSLRTEFGPAESLRLIGLPESLPFDKPVGKSPLNDWLIWRGPEALRVQSIHRNKVVSIAAVFFAFCGLAGAGFFYQSAAIHPTLSVLALFLSVELLLVPWLVKNERHVDVGGALVMTALVGSVCIVAYLAGGINQPLMGLVVAMPVLATVLLSPRAGLVVTFSLCVILAWFLVLHINGYVPTLTVLPSDDDQTVLRGCVLMLGTILTAASIWAYETRTQQYLERYRAQHEDDVVTGQMNRWQFEIAFREQLRQAQSGSARAAMLLIDIDDFGVLNTTFGRSLGDEVLRRTGAAIHASVVGPGSVVARMEADCFALFCWCPTKATLRTLNDRIQLLVAGAAEDISHQMQRSIRVSIGVGMLSNQERTHPDSGQWLYSRAAQALAAAKLAGGNKVRLQAMSE